MNQKITTKISRLVHLGPKENRTKRIKKMHENIFSKEIFVAITLDQSHACRGVWRNEISK